MKTTWAVWAGVVAALAGGCFVVDPFADGAGGGCATESGVGMLGACCSPSSTLACAGHEQKLKLVCGPDGKWASNGTCDAADTVCDSTVGPDRGTCKPIVAACKGQTPGDVVCDGDKRVECGPDLATTKDIEVCPYLCSGGACSGSCKPGDGQCVGNVPKTCDMSGEWLAGGAPCAAVCVAGSCLSPPSCAGLPSTCGAAGNENCCQLDVVPGGIYDRSNDKMYPAALSDFWLNRFEITVGRFRAFVAAYPGDKPKGGAGAHPAIAGSGWDTAWDALLPLDKATLMTDIIMKCTPSHTWTDAPGANENLPMNCISWHEAFAFCAWDGGRLPTEAEWNYAAAGGGEQRQYPWGSAVPDPTYAVYGGAQLMNVGSKPAGDGKWGQADLAGSVWEWNLDWYADPYANPCDNCANLTTASKRGMRGGSWYQSASSLLSSVRSQYVPTDRSVNVGFRCARTP